MLKTIGSVVLGYVIIFIWVMLTFTLAWQVLGSSFAFEPGTSRVTAGWIGVAIPLNVIGAILGGWVAAKAGGLRAVRGLMGLVVLLGLALAVAQIFMAAPTMPEGRMAGELSASEAASSAVQPLWYSLLIPFVAALGIWLGGRPARTVERPATV